MSDLDTIVKEFLVESHENLDQLDRDLVALEKDPGDRERLASVFRTIHTVKGTCGFFNFSRLGALTHAGESLLSQLRDGKLRLTPAITSSLLALVDAVRRTLGRIERTGQEGEEDHAELIALLTEMGQLQGQLQIADCRLQIEESPPGPSEQSAICNLQSAICNRRGGDPSR